MFYKLVNAFTRRFSFPHRGLKYFLKAAKWLGMENKTYSKKLAKDFYMQVNPSEHIQRQLFWYGHYEKELGDLIKNILKPHDVFLDIGANIGYFSLLAARQEPTATIIAFEPVSLVFKRLKENISINHVTNVRAVNAAIGERNEDQEIYISADDNIGMSSFRKPENYSGKTQKTRVIAIDQWLGSTDLLSVDLVKLDVEGSELAALKGMHETLEKFKPLLIVEVNPVTLLQFDLKPSDIFGYLAKINFSGFLLLKDGRLRELTGYETGETNNVLFIHRENIRLYKNLF